MTLHRKNKNNSKSPNIPNNRQLFKKDYRIRIKEKLFVGILVASC